MERFDLNLKLFTMINAGRPAASGTIGLALILDEPSGPGIDVAGRRGLGAHLPLDMLGALFAALAGNALAAPAWPHGGPGAVAGLQNLYRRAFALPIGRRWINP